MLTEEHRAELEAVLKELLMQEWKAQGHFMNGKIVDEMELKVSETVDGFEASGMMYPYGGYQEHGVQASNIPFSGRSGRGGTSKYIEALIGYVQKRMAITDLKEAKSVAFAIAHTHKKEGMPSFGSKQYSSTGKRTGWIMESLINNRDHIGAVILRIMGDAVTKLITANIEKYGATLQSPIIIRL